MSMTAKQPRKAKQNGNGSGTVWKEGSAWRWQITLGYSVNSKRITRSGRESTKTAAQGAMIKAQADYSRGLTGNPEKVTVKEYAERWLRMQIEVTPRTAKRYGEELDYALKHIGHLRLQDVRPNQLKEVIGLLLREPLPRTGMPMSPRTIAHVRTRLKSLFREAVIDQIIYVNPMESVRPPKTRREISAGQPLDFDGAARLHTIGTALHAAGLLRLWPALFTAVGIGLRRGEVMGLTWKDVDLSSGVLYVRQTRVMGVKGIETGSPKTVNSQREIQMPASLIAVLQAHRIKQAKERAEAGTDWRHTEAVFATALGDWTHPDNLKRSLQMLLKWSDPLLIQKEETKAGAWRGVPREQRAALTAAIQSGEALPNISPHDLRHTYATLALRSGIPIEVVSRNLGHATISITLDVYRHVLDSERRSRVVDLFANVPPPPTGIIAALN